MRRIVVLISGALLAACGFDPLRPAATAAPELDDLEGAVTISGIQVRPAVIRPGEAVELRDPVKPNPSLAAPLYFWDACGGQLGQKVAQDRQATWVAPPEPGRYAVTVNITNSEREQRSRVLSLCVVAGGQTSCSAEGASDGPALGAVTATPSSLSCGGGSCETTLGAQVTGSVRRYQWGIRRGQIVGQGAQVRYLLPTVGCCSESHPVAFTACGESGSAATGNATVLVTPQ